MLLELVVVVLQALSVVALGAVGILKLTRHPNGGLKKAGKVLIIFAAFTYVCSTSGLHLLNTSKQERLMKRIEDHQIESSNWVMESPPEIIRLSPVEKLTTDLQILKPVTNAVDWRPYIEGRVKDTKAEVWIIIHPVGLSSYWVQPPITVRRDGTWQIQVYIGRAGYIDIGKHFEIIAIADPKNKLTEGRILSRWPKARWQSNLLSVIRE